MNAIAQRFGRPRRAWAAHTAKDMGERVARWRGALCAGEQAAAAPVSIVLARVWIGRRSLRV